MSAPLDQFQEEHAREIAQQAVRNFARLLADALVPLTGGGYIHGRDLWTVLNETIKRFDQGDVA